MGLYNNVPTFTYVSASGITVTYNKEVYTVQSFYTNKKYIYWDYDNATVLQASNTMPTRSFKTHLVIINDNGIATLVPSTYEGFEISFGGDSDESIKSRIYALYEKNKELGDKYVAIEQDIEGIKQIVGSGGSGNSDVIDRVSKIEQTAEEIKLSVNEMKKTYADDEEMDKLREDLNSSIIKLNGDLGTLSSEMSDYYKDNEITYEEKIGIEEGIALIANSKSEVLKYVNKVILICEEDNQNENLIALNSGISALENAHENLVRNITVAISDSVITPSEKTVIIDSFARYNLRINELKNTCDDIIFLGVGGVVSEKLAQITMNSNEIKLSVSSVESSMTSQLSLQKAELEGQINDVNSQLGSFKDTVETTFKDGILDEAEKKLLEEKLSLLEKEKLDVDAQYEAIYNDEYLVEPYKQTLKDEYNKYTSKHLELKAKINEVIKHEKVTESDLLAVKTLFNDCSSLLASLNVYLNNSLDVIATGKSNKEILAAKNELLKELEETNSKIDDIIFDIGDFVGDGLVDEAEKKAIELSLQSLEKEKLDIDAQYNYWYSNSYLVNPLKSEYKNAYDNYVLKYNNSVDIITGIANKTELVSDTDRENMLNAHRLLADTLELFVEKANQVIEFVSQKQSEALKSDLQGEIDDINNKLGDLDLVIDGTFEDNIIDRTERKILAQNLSDLELQKIDVTEQYDQLYKSLYLDGTLKTQFKTSYDNFMSKYNILISNIQDVLEKTELINDTDRENVNKAQLNLNESFGNFVSKSNEVIEYISKKQSDESIGNFNNELKDLNDKVDNILDDVGGALSDDVLDRAERKILEDGLNDLEVQKNDVVVQYENTYNNENLADTTVKNNLKNSYNNFISKYNALVDNIRYLLDKSGDITDDNRLSYKNAYDEYKSSVISFTESFYAANNSITDKSMNDLKSTFNAEISELNNAINNLDETMNGIFKDGILSEAEKVSIREQLTILEREKVDVDNNYNSVYSNSSLSSSVKTNLKSSYDSYVLSYNNLVNIINSILNKAGIISSTEQTSYKNALVSYKGALGSYTSKLRSAIDDITNNSIDDAKRELSQEISDVISSLESLENNMNEVFKDGVLSEAEKTTIKQQLETLKKEKGDVDKQYTALYNNESLVDTTSSKPKSELKTAYDNFVSKYNSLVTVINNIVSKTTIVDNADRTNLSNALSNYRTASSNYITKATNAIDAIASKKAANESEKVDEKYADIILGEDGIINRVGSVETTTTIALSTANTANNTANNANNLANTANNTANTNKNNIATLQSTVTTTNNRVAELTTNLDGITQRVASTESTVTSHTTQLSTVDNRINTAKQDAISSAVGVKDTRNTNENPQWYFTNYPRRTVEEFKYANRVGISGSNVYGVLTTIVPWTESSGGYPTQTFRSNSTATYTRKGTSNTAWGAWTQVEDTAGSQAKATQALNDAKAYTTTEVTKTNNKVATIETNLNSITSRVSATESNLTTTTNKLNNLQVGSTNLLVGSSDVSKFTDYWANNGCSILNSYYKGSRIYKVSNAWNDYGFKLPSLSSELATGKRYTYSVYVKSSSSSYLPEIGLYGGGWSTKIGTATTSWQRLTFKGTFSDLTAQLRIEPTSNSSDGANAYLMVAGMQLEEGEILTDYSPSPKDSEITVSNLTTRVSTAESKLTKDSLTTTIGSHYTTSNDVNGIVTSKGYATTSQVQQTKDDLTATFKGSGGYNLLRNGCANLDTSYWYSNGGGISRALNASGGYVGNFFSTSMPSGITGEWVRLKNNVDYVYQAKICLPNGTFTGSDSTPLHYWCSTSQTSGSSQLTVLDYSATIPQNGWTQCYVHFKTKASGAVWFKPFIYTGSGTQTIYVTELMLSESKVVLPYSPHPSEIYEGITKIDKDGIQVSQSNISTTTKMNANGFYINKGGADVFKVDSGGLVMNGNVTATSGRVANFTISGNDLIGSNVGISGASGTNYAFWAGSNTSSSAPFRVGHDGILRATNAEIRGTITGSNISGTTFTSSGTDSNSYQYQTMSLDSGALRMTGSQVGGTNDGQETNKTYLTSMGLVVKDSSYGGFGGNANVLYTNTGIYWNSKERDGEEYPAWRQTIGFYDNYVLLDKDVTSSGKYLGAGLFTTYTNLYVGCEGEVRATDMNGRNDGNTVYKPIRASKFMRADGKHAYINNTGGGTLTSADSALVANGMRTDATDFFLGVADSGQLRITNKNGYNNGNGLTYKPITASAHNNSSDLIFKKNIKKLDDSQLVKSVSDSNDSYAIQTLKQVGVYQYDLVDGEKDQLGLIAQECPSILRGTDDMYDLDIDTANSITDEERQELKEKDKNGASINLYAMSSMLWKVCQEQQEMIEKLEKRINELENKSTEM